MSSIEIFTIIGDILQGALGSIFNVIGNYFNFFLLMFGFFGFIYWMNLQRGYNKAAENDSNQLK